MHTGALSWQQHTRDYQRRGVTSTDGGVQPQYTLVCTCRKSKSCNFVDSDRNFAKCINMRSCCNTGFLVCVSYEYNFQLSSFLLNINKTHLSDYSRL